jgi:hypothetical protein
VEVEVIGMKEGVSNRAKLYCSIHLNEVHLTEDGGSMFLQGGEIDFAM